MTHQTAWSRGTWYLWLLVKTANSMHASWRLRTLLLHLLTNQCLSVLKNWKSSLSLSSALCLCTVKSFWTATRDNRTAVISASAAVSQTPAYAAKPRIRHYHIVQCACLLTPQLLLVLVSSHRGMARLSWPEWLDRYWQGFLPIPVLIGPTYSNYIDWDQHVLHKNGRLA